MAMYVYELVRGVLIDFRVGGVAVPAGLLEFAMALGYFDPRPTPAQRRRIEEARAAWRGVRMPELAAVDSRYGAAEGGTVLRWRRGQVTANDTATANGRGMGGRRAVGVVLMPRGRPTLFPRQEGLRFLERRDLAHQLARMGLAEVEDTTGEDRPGFAIAPTPAGIAAAEWPRPPLVAWDGMRPGPAAYFERIGCPLDMDGRPMAGISEFSVRPIPAADARRAGLLSG